MINTSFTRRELAASGPTDVTYRINARVHVGYLPFYPHGEERKPITRTFRAVDFSFPQLKLMPVAFRRVKGDPGSGLPTTFQHAGDLTVIGTWINEKFHVYFQSLDHGEREVVDDYGDDHVLLKSLCKLHPWLWQWLQDVQASEEHFLPESVAPTSSDSGVYKMSIGYARLKATYAGVEDYISYADWMAVPKTDRLLTPINTTEYVEGRIFRRGTPLRDSSKVSVGDKIVQHIPGVSIKVFRVAE